MVQFPERSETWHFDGWFANGPQIQYMIHGNWMELNNHTAGSISFRQIPYAYFLCQLCQVNDVAELLRKRAEADCRPFLGGELFLKTTVGWMLGMLGEWEPPNYQLKSYWVHDPELWSAMGRPLQLFNIHGRALHRPTRLMLRARQRCRVVAETCRDSCDIVRDILQGSRSDIQTAMNMLWVHSHLWISLRTQILIRSFLDHSWWPSELWEHRFKSFPAFLRHILPISLSQHQSKSWTCAHRHI